MHENNLCIWRWINLTGNVCGAITGALMTLGLKYGGNIQEVTKISSQLIEEFKKLMDQ